MTAETPFGPMCGTGFRTIRPAMGRGGNAMKFVGDAVDYGAPEFVVTGPAEVERISAGQVRVSYYMRRNGENVIVCHIVWDAVEIARSMAVFRRFHQIENRDKFVEVN